jgi:hypothetical protein
VNATKVLMLDTDEELQVRQALLNSRAANWAYLRSAARESKAKAPEEVHRMHQAERRIAIIDSVLNQLEKATRRKP